MMMKASMMLALAISLANAPAHAQDQCLSPAELRAFTTLFVDKGSEAVAARCAERFPADSPFAKDNYSAIMSRFDDRRAAAYERLLAKFAPMLAGSAGMASASAAIVGPIIESMVAQGLDKDLSPERCAELDGMMEALHVLKDEQIIAVTEVLMRRNLKHGGNPQFVPCEQP